ncbi:MAG: Phenylalanine-tRNA ligase beta subunit [Parcubacteria group bacterium GW2011_GWB1_43_8]|nr:MAG: Phenylalanine-tRNA ligase beta subunit [Parcubacteria group bacterium GW2011_GWB1_43_8]
MKISYSWLQSHFDEKLPEPEKLAELLTMHSQEVESVEPKNGDYELNVKVLPNRAYDYVDYLGVIRDIAAILKLDAKIFLPEPKEREIIFVKESDFEKIMGVKISEKEITDILSRLGMETSKKEEIFSVGVPSERPDLKIKEDIIEEVARIYGYEKIEEKTPEGLLVPPKRNDSLFFASITRKIMVGLGFSEVYNYSFTEGGDWELQNPPSQDKKFLRTNLAEGLEANVKENSKSASWRSKNIKVFELGKIFPENGERLAFGAINNKADFYEMKGLADELLFGLGIDDFYYKDHDSRVAEVQAGGKTIGHIDNNSFEFDFDELVKLADESIEYEPVSKYPAIVRDIAVFVPLNEKVENVLDAIENTAGKLLVDTDLFDIYENKERKSLAFHLIFQSPEKTLTDGEINAITQKVFEAMEANPDWEVRK